MTYSTIAEIQHSNSLMNRVNAAVASEVTAGNAPGDTSVIPTWTSRRSWDIAATPGWALKWESALAGGISDPGDNDGVITDADLLSRIQQLLTQYPLSDIVIPGI